VPNIKFGPKRIFIREHKGECIGLLLPFDLMSADISTLDPRG
jgi:hypothetical protein